LSAHLRRPPNHTAGNANRVVPESGSLDVRARPHPRHRGLHRSKRTAWPEIRFWHISTACCCRDRQHHPGQIDGEQPRRVTDPRSDQTRWCNRLAPEAHGLTPKASNRWFPGLPRVPGDGGSAARPRSAAALGVGPEFGEVWPVHRIAPRRNRPSKPCLLRPQGRQRSNQRGIGVTRAGSSRLADSRESTVAMLSCSPAYRCSAQCSIRQFETRRWFRAGNRSGAPSYEGRGAHRRVGCVQNPERSRLLETADEIDVLTRVSPSLRTSDRPVCVARRPRFARERVDDRRCSVFEGRRAQCEAPEMRTPDREKPSATRRRASGVRELRREPGRAHRTVGVRRREHTSEKRSTRDDGNARGREFRLRRAAPTFRRSTRTTVRPRSCRPRSRQCLGRVGARGRSTTTNCVDPGLLELRQPPRRAPVRQVIEQAAPACERQQPRRCVHFLR